MAYDFSTEATLRELVYVITTINPLLQPLATESTVALIAAESQLIESAVNIIQDQTAPASQYYAVAETISADKTYTPTFPGKNMILYTSKAVIVKLNNSGNDAIALAARIGLRFDNQVISSVILSSVPLNTDVNLVITG